MTKTNIILLSIAIVAVIALAVILTLYIQQDSNTSPKEADVKDDDSNPANYLAPEGHSRGSKDALVTIVEYSDFQCPFCTRFHTTMKQVMENYEGKVLWVYKHFPLDSIHPYARKAAEASECAADQDKFWEYNDELFANQSLISFDFLEIAASNIGLNTGKFNECLSSGKYTSKVDADYKEGIKMGVTGTPGSFLNGKVLGGAVPYESLSQYIDDLIN